MEKLKSKSKIKIPAQGDTVTPEEFRKFERYAWNLRAIQQELEARYGYSIIKLSALGGKLVVPEGMDIGKYHLPDQEEIESLSVEDLERLLRFLRNLHLLKIREVNDQNE